MKKTLRSALSTLLVMLLFISIASIGYLITTGVLYIIFQLLSYGGHPIDFNIWIGGLIMYIFILIFNRK